MMRTKLGFFALLLMTLFALLPSAALAQPSKAELARADKLYNQGKAALDAGRLDEACSKLAESLAIDRGVGTLLNLARCHERKGMNVVAWREYSDAHALARERNDQERATGARQLADKLAAKLPRLKIDVRSAQSGLAIQRDGGAVPPSELGVAIPIEPGSHTVTAALAGHQTFTTTVQVGATPDTTTVTIDELIAEGRPKTDASPVTPITQPAPTTASSEDGPRPLLIAGIVVGSVGVAGLGVGAAFGVLTMNELSSAEEDPALCPQRQCTTAGREAVDGAATKGLISTIGFAVGGAALATGIVLIIADVVGSGSKQDPTVGAAPGPGDVGAAIRWSF